MNITQHIKLYLRIIHSLLTQIGINLLKFKNIIYFLKFFADVIKYKKANGKINYLFPVIGEHVKNSGEIVPHYFYQDLIVAEKIYKNNPIKHVDFGSRLDGFITHIASFRKVEVFDIRYNKINHKNIKFYKLDINNINKKNYTDSLSCLHTLEHFGLGRYGDKIDPDGYKKGFNNLIKILKKNGLLYISFPISHVTENFFNAERRFNPLEVTKWSKKLKLINFDYIDDNEKIYYNINLFKLNTKPLFNGCGIYTFKKI